VRPNQRQLTEIRFLKNENYPAGASSRLLIWGLRLAPDAVKLKGRLLNPEKLVVDSRADWDWDHGHAKVEWSVVHVQRNEAVVQPEIPSWPTTRPRPT
jgi:hypothetical protein